MPALAGNIRIAATPLRSKIELKDNPLHRAGHGNMAGFLFFAKYPTVGYLAKAKFATVANLKLGLSGGLLQRLCTGNADRRQIAGSSVAGLVQKLLARPERGGENRKERRKIRYGSGFKPA